MPERTSAPHFFQEGDRYRDKKQWAAAATAYRNGLALDPTAFDFWVQLGHSLKESGDLQAAEVAYLEALQIKYTDNDLHLQLGHFYSQVNKTELAENHYLIAATLGSVDPHTQLERSNPDETANIFRQADLHRDEARWADAAILYEKGLARNPTSFEMWVQLGHALKEAGLFRRAEAAYLRGLSLGYNDGDLSVQLGHLYVRFGESGRALDYYIRSIGLGSRDPHALSHLSTHPNSNRSVKIAMARVVEGEEQTLAVLGSSDEPKSFVRFVLETVTSCTHT